MAAKGIVLPNVLIERCKVNEQDKVDDCVSKKLALPVYEADEITTSRNVLKNDLSKHIVPFIKQEAHYDLPEKDAPFGLIKADVSTDLVRVKEENETRREITHELVGNLPSSLSSNQLKYERVSSIEEIWGHIEDHCNRNSENVISIFPQLEPIGSFGIKNAKSDAQYRLQSKACHNSFPLVISNVTVKLVDIFSDEARKSKEMHYNNRSCSCVFCRGVYKDRSSSHLLSLNFANFIKHNLPNSKPIVAKNSVTRLSYEKRGLLNCPVCKTSLEAHWVTHCEKYKCCLCNVMFKSESNLPNHMMRAHGIVKAHSCSVCLKSFRGKGVLYTHLKMHSDDRPFKCDLCPKAYKIKQHLTVHKGSIHFKERSQCCNLCTAKFYQKNTLLDHMKSIHSYDKPFDCKVCFKSFKLKSHLVKHSRMHSSEKPFKCELCPATFRYRQSAKEHVRIHSNERPYCCSICPQSFKYSSHLMAHERRHTVKTIFTCHLCSATFKTRGTVSTHIRICHLEKKPIKCNLCDFKTASNTVLKKHIRAHESKRQFKCSVCPLTFNRMITLEKHIKIMHTGGSNDLRFDCKLCQVRFPNKRSLALHHKLHSKVGPFKCNLCLTMFSEYLNWEKHIDGHRLGKMFFCAHCPVAYLSKISIQKHLKEVHKF